MASYVITGANRNIGFEFTRQYSADPANTVVALVRNKEAAEKVFATDLGRSNIHVVQADLLDYEALKTAAAKVGEITGGKLDYLIANAGVISTLSNLSTFPELAEDPKALEEDLLYCFRGNVVGQVNLFNAFLPLIRKGSAKKVLALSSGHAEPQLARQIAGAGPYTASKAALNMIVAKYSAAYSKEGILFLALSPGFIDTSGNQVKPTEKELPHAMEVMRVFQTTYPHWKGAPESPEVAVKLIRDTLDRSSVEHGDGGTFVSQFGNQTWL